MTLENLDWEGERLRILSAFGINVECEWQLLVSGAKQLKQGDRMRLDIDGLELLVYYSEWLRSFTLGCGKDYVYIGFEDDHIDECYPDERFSPILAKALYYLGELTPAVESALKVTVTSHQKLEWGLSL